MIRAVLIDDEKNALEVLQMQLERYCDSVQIVASCAGGEAGVQAIKTWQPDVVFLDIEMPHVNGFQVLEQTAMCSYQVIFTTAYDQFAIRAFKYAAVDYLLKPIDIEDLQQAVAKVAKTHPVTSLEETVKRLVYQYQVNAQPKRIAFPVGNMLEFFDADEIVRAESESNYTHIFFNNHKKIMLSKTLKEVEETLGGHPFFRIHQSHLINTNHIDKAVRGEGAYVVMRDGTTLTISRQKKELFFEQFRRF